MGAWAAAHFLHVPISRDFIGKALLVSVCVVIYYAFARMSSFDWDMAKRRIVIVSASFTALLLLDQYLGTREGEVSTSVLFAALLGCKQAYATVENALEDGQDDLCLRHLLPLRPLRQELRQVIVDDAAQGNPLSTALTPIETDSDAQLEDGRYAMLQSVSAPQQT
eukprot:TRINITY_DN20148_c0_g1_i2.p1 TRINITY_DN20148_c0_g1~~TRINITY_DN20148_c0_g1_i2.p1  ORF type:complete len:166 (+),score=14.94 TRINITY_DN20148_c0_g1_i2:2-499(+)